jgi:hypothetical protein
LRSGGASGEQPEKQNGNEAEHVQEIKGTGQFWASAQRNRILYSLTDAKRFFTVNAD